MLSVAEPEFGFGDVVVGQPRVHRFTLKNVGASPLVITDVSGSCSCTVTALAERQIAPGGATTLTVNYRPNALTGPDHQTIQLRTNDPVRPIFELSVRAIVQPEIRFEPPTLRLQTDADRPKPVATRLVGTAVIRANLHLLELRGDKSATKQVDAKVNVAPYDADHRPELRVVLKRGHALRGNVYAVVLTGLPDPTQIIVPIEWGQE